MSEQRTLIDAPSEKAIVAAPTAGARPQRYINTLKATRGYVVLEGTEAKPLKVRVCPMDAESVWERLPGAGGMFEQVT